MSLVVDSKPVTSAAPVHRTKGAQLVQQSFCELHYEHCAATEQHSRLSVPASNSTPQGLGIVGVETHQIGSKQ